jgi:hypothetical protein
MLNEEKAEGKGKGQEVNSVIPGVPKEGRAKGVQAMPLATVPLPLAGGGVGAANVYILSETLPPMGTSPSLRRWPRSLTSPLLSLLGGVGGQ